MLCSPQTLRHSPDFSLQATLRTVAVVLAFCLGSSLAFAAKRAAKPSPAPAPVTQQPSDSDGVAEARLIEVYTLIGKGQNREALAKAEHLAQDLPHFQLAQLVYGDLLAARTRPLAMVGDVPEAMAREASGTLGELREESLRRVRALKERPTAGMVPTQFLQLSQRTKHAIAVDASRSRLYLFENTASGLNLVADYYISVGKAGTSKTAEGDQRTPLGIYYITSNLDRKSLKEFYGSGALPINYPNILDTKRGKTGGGIWLHGTPPNQFSRPPLATDGCVVLANPDLDHIIRTVEVRSTPVVISPQLQWASPNSSRGEAKPFEDALLAWRNAKTSGDINQVLSFYTSDFSSNGKSLAQWTPTLRSEMDKMQGRTIQLKDVSYLRWTDSADTMVATFGEVADGVRVGWTKRQYWIRQGNHWKIFFEGVL
ncbi:L,D-transpeptidase family protein [Rhodoferax saidenbachensis]|uniref:Murein L,D-transpeptidase YafK n=1 Tax=Rhodoferax saidenbachensis TaxID=1484693 RepID=A0ABU1ZTY3_9BURK|nr:L,D-transpeptidase family protein [Rhodoferax saidenbachensis]MDR7308411.1 murein L,D-transpeptidase YafK [Rhodoferax saidenbachensis]